jgi:hypothetical protein
MSIDIKLYFDGEIRRFAFSGSFKQLESKVCELLSRANLALSYVDEDGDHVRCSSDEEFEHAKRFMRNNVLHVHAKQTEPTRPLLKLYFPATASPASPASPAPEAPATPAVGFRKRRLLEILASVRASAEKDARPAVKNFEHWLSKHLENWKDYPVERRQNVLEKAERRVQKQQQPRWAPDARNWRERREERHEKTPWTATAEARDELVRRAELCGLGNEMRELLHYQDLAQRPLPVVNWLLRHVDRWDNYKPERKEMVSAKIADRLAKFRIKFAKQ